MKTPPSPIAALVNTLQSAERIRIGGTEYPIGEIKVHQSCGPNCRPFAIVQLFASASSPGPSPFEINDIATQLLQAGFHSGEHGEINLLGVLASINPDRPAKHTAVLTANWRNRGVSADGRTPTEAIRNAVSILLRQ